MSSNWYVRRSQEHSFTQEDFQVWKSELTGKTYDSRQALIAEETAERMRRYQPTEEEKLMESLSLDQVKVLGRKIEEDERKKEADDYEFSNAVVFAELNPAFVQCPANAKQMEHWLRSRGIQEATVERLEEGYRELKAAGLLQINAQVEQQQRRDQLKQRAEEIRQQRATTPTEAELYEAPLDSRPRYGWYR